uniref:Uncharacterized protein n=1 Tax=Chlamydomonas euryale TaxID=1486919 RepID=A0A7R9V8J4_9CHLO|mmetsp:Transcript_26028/g.77178  ORF Transcript_26028/g.77178 Transcript_26028/m.77178 type:complete len:304 (+) Transcript_26028:199-1110(+)
MRPATIATSGPRGGPVAGRTSKLPAPPNAPHTSTPRCGGNAANTKVCMLGTDASSAMQPGAITARALAAKMGYPAHATDSASRAPLVGGKPATATRAQQQQQRQQKPHERQPRSPNRSTHPATRCQAALLCGGGCVPMFAPLTPAKRSMGGMYGAARVPTSSPPPPTKRQASGYARTATTAAQLPRSCRPSTAAPAAPIRGGVGTAAPPAGRTAAAPVAPAVPYPGPHPGPHTLQTHGEPRPARYQRPLQPLTPRVLKPACASPTSRGAYAAFNVGAATDAALGVASLPPGRKQAVQPRPAWR